MMGGTGRGSTYLASVEGLGSGKVLAIGPAGAVVAGGGRSGRIGVLPGHLTINQAR